jgi:tetratricopeptide (TPR) repeat protein
MKTRILKMIAGIIVLSAISGISLNAQVVRNDVIKAYNEGAKASQTDVNAAIGAFENVVVLADQVGESCNDLKQKAMQILPGLYYKAAYNNLNEKKPAPEIILAAKKAVAAAEKYGSDANKENAGKILIQAYSTMAAEYFTNNDYENALLAYDSVLLVNPDYLTGIYNKALIYMRQNNVEDFEQTVDQFIEKAKAANDEEKVNQGSTLALEYFRAAGSQANQAENLDEALIMFDKAAKYGEDKDLFYFYADVYNKQKNFNSGAEYAQKGLDLETGDAEAKAKFYYQLAVAQAGKGQTANACASFKNALYGPFADAAKAQRTNLKCE